MPHPPRQTPALGEYTERYPEHAVERRSVADDGQGGARRQYSEDPARAELVNLRGFAGMTMPGITLVMRISPATAERYWTYARTWLYAELKDREISPSS